MPVEFDEIYTALKRIHHQPDLFKYIPPTKAEYDAMYWAALPTLLMMGENPPYNPPKE